MTYEISKSVDYFTIDFKVNQDIVQVRIKELDPPKMHITSPTKGYGDLQFWMAQEPGATRAIILPFEDEMRRVQQSMLAHGFLYLPYHAQEGLNTVEGILQPEPNDKITEKAIERIASFLEPRFALGKNISSLNFSDYF